MLALRPTLQQRLSPPARAIDRHGNGRFRLHVMLVAIEARVSHHVASGCNPPAASRAKPNRPAVTRETTGSSIEACRTLPAAGRDGGGTRHFRVLRHGTLRTGIECERVRDDPRRGADGHVRASGKRLLRLVLDQQPRPDDALPRIVVDFGSQGQRQCQAIAARLLRRVVFDGDTRGIGPGAIDIDRALFPPHAAPGNANMSGQ